MTNREALVDYLGLGRNVAGIGKALVDSGLVDTEQYIASSSGAIERASIDVLLSYAIQGESEGDVSVSYDVKEIKAKLLFLAKKYGRNDVMNAVSPQPVIRYKSLW